MNKIEEFYKEAGGIEYDKFDKKADKFTYYDMIGFADAYHSKQLIIADVGNRLSKMEEAGKEATSLIAHLKDQHGFNDEEQASLDKIMAVFKYEGDW
jgi:hypothetical protein